VREFEIIGKSKSCFRYERHGKPSRGPWSIADAPHSKKRYRLPTILSQEEIAQLIDAAPTPFYRSILMALYGTGVRRAGGPRPNQSQNGLI